MVGDSRREGEKPRPHGSSSIAFGVVSVLVGSARISPLNELCVCLV